MEVKNIIKIISLVSIVLFFVLAFILIKKHPEEFQSPEDKLPKQDKYIAKKINGQVEIIENPSYREPKYIYNSFLGHPVRNPKYKELTEEEIQNYKPQYDFWDEERKKEE